MFSLLSGYGYPYWLKVTKLFSFPMSSADYSPSILYSTVGSSAFRNQHTVAGFFIPFINIKCAIRIHSDVFGEGWAVADLTLRIHWATQTSPFQRHH